MAKEVDLKRIELKVSVNCCDGCKRKVKKALRNVEGVLKTEIDPSQPKLTVIGNMDPLILIKKLTKVGKQTEILSVQGIQNATKENHEMGKEAAKEKENQIPECEQVKYPDSGHTKAVKTKENTDGDNEGEKKASKNEQNDTDIYSKLKKKEKKAKTVTDNNEVMKNEDQVNFHMNPSMVHEMDRTHTQYCYKVEPCAVPIPCYAVPSYSYHVAPAPPIPPMSYGYENQDYYNYERPVYHPAYQAPVMRAGDYFSDENTIGCHIM